MDKRRLIECICASIFTILLQSLYSHMFGHINSLVGVIMGMSIYLFLKMDFTLNIEYRMCTFLIMVLFLGGMSYVSMLNPWIGIIVNFITIFIISFIYISDFTSTISYCFLLMYVFMSAYPINLSQLNERLFSLIFGVVLLIASQLIFNRNKFKRISKKIIIDIIGDIKDEINNTMNDNYKSKDNSVIDEKLRNLLTLINGRNNKKFFSLKREDRLCFSLAIALERLNIIIGEVNASNVDKKIKEEYLKDLNLQLDSIIYFINNIKEVNKINKSFTNFINKYKRTEWKCDFIYESMEIIELFKYDISNLNKNVDKNFIKLSSGYSLVNEFIPISFIDKFFDIKSLKFSYSFKLAIAVSIVMFFVDIFNIPNGKWIIITTYVVIQPYGETTVAKAKKRFKGTLIGVTLFFIGANFFPNIIPKVLIMLIVLTIFFYAKDYYLKVICTSIISLSIAITTTNIIEMSLTRFVFIIIGILVALFFNKFLFPYNSWQCVDDLKNKYIKLTNYMIYEANEIFKNNKNEKRLIKLALYCNLIESKLLSVISKDNEEELQNFLNKQKLIISDIRFLLLGIYCIDNKKYLKKTKLNEKILNKLLDKVNRELIKGELEATMTYESFIEYVNDREIINSIKDS